MRIGLKIAIVRSRQSQRTISRLTGIPEVRLSNIVTGVADPRDDERRVLERHLHVQPTAFEIKRAKVRPG